MLFNIDKFNIAAESRIIMFQLLNDLLDFLDIFLYIFHESPFLKNRQIIVTDWSYFEHA